MIQRQERQIVQSMLNLDDFLPGFTPSQVHLISVEVGGSTPPGPIFLPPDPNFAHFSDSRFVRDRARRNIGIFPRADGC